jgi:hypothetical protein
MALCPFAVIKLLHPENDPGGEPLIVPTQLILHTAVSKAASLYGYFSRADVRTESTFYIAADGTLEQYMDTCRQADAQFDGNLHGLSVETWDDGDPNNTPLNAAQIATYLRLARWLNATHGIPLHICDSPQEPGLGYHSLFHAWAKDGHTCPNPLRIAQFHDRLLPAFAAHEDDMTPEEHTQLWNTRSDLQSLHVKVDQLTALVNSKPAGASNTAGIDYETLATRVADKLAGRLAS